MFHDFLQETPAGDENLNPFANPNGDLYLSSPGKHTRGSPLKPKSRLSIRQRPGKLG